VATRITVLVDDRKALGGLSTEHGAAFWIEHEGRKLLFDVGSSGRVLLENAALLGIRVEEAEAILLSHGHFDHSGGLGLLAPRLGGVDLYAHPAAFGRKYTRASSGAFHSIGIGMSQAQLEALGILCRLSKGSQEVVPDALLTGEVERDPRFVPSTPHLYTDAPSGRIIDPFADDQALVLRTEGGLVVVAGCAHAGIINLCRGAQRLMNPRRLIGKDHLRAVVGGFHLSAAAPQLVEATAQGFRELDPEVIHPSHCTGEAAVHAFNRVLPDSCRPISAGSVLEF
jgi:7,8-dihydropterin-6-yl-methyl-4-(beta-D-ribofuranosyl)aminobenzene 5'-phosphate synthase